MRALTLDTGDIFGWAFGDPYKDMIPFSGSFHLPDLPPSAKMIALENFVINIIKANEITDVYVEQNFIPTTTSFQAITVLAGYVLMSAIAATRCNCKASTIELSTWRKELGLPTQGPKTVLSHPDYKHFATNKNTGAARKPKDALSEARRRWVKDRAMDYARKMGADPKDDNEGDAICMWLYKKQRLLKKLEAIGTKRDLFDDLKI